MATRTTGISREFIIHPGEMIADVLVERGITQAELAKRTGVSDAFISSILAGKKNISARFAMALEYALGVSKSFWLNLQANYDAEILTAEEMETITENELSICAVLRDVVKQLRKSGVIPVAQKKEETVLSLRKALRVSDLSNLGKMSPAGAFRMAERATVNEYVLGAWLQLYGDTGKTRTMTRPFSETLVPELITELKSLMNDPTAHPQKNLPEVLSKYGIDIRIVRNFKGAPVQGYITKRKDDTYQLILTIRGAWADIFWFSLFHEIGHIVNGDVNKCGFYLESADEDSPAREAKANAFAAAALIDPQEYARFEEQAEYSLTAMEKFANEQNVPTYIVIGRLQRDGHIPYEWYTKHKLRYKWNS